MNFMDGPSERCHGRLHNCRRSQQLRG